MVATKNKIWINKEIKKLALISYTNHQQLKDIGVLAGRSGVALLQFHCAKYFDDDKYSTFGVEIIESCLELINNGYIIPTYCNGIAGFGWVIQHLKNMDFIDLDVDALLKPFDTYLYENMNTCFDSNVYDFLHGALGYGFYFLKRYTSEKTSQKLRGQYREKLNNLLNRLENLALSEGKCFKWESILNLSRGNIGYNLSLSHGMSSIIYFLNKLYQNGIQPLKTSRLIAGAIQYIIKFERKNSDGLSLFPSWIEEKSPLEYNSRVAWCYGDIGIGKAFQWSGQILGEQAFVQKAKDIWVHASKRRTFGETRVEDAAFCHGSFGLTHFFNQIKLEHQLNELDESVDFWINDGLIRRTSTENQPYNQWNAITQKFDFNLSLLEGISGIGLCLMDWARGQKSEWDECVMMN